MAILSRSKVLLALLLAVLTLLAYNKSFSPQELVVRLQESSQLSDNFTKSRHDDSLRSTTSSRDDTQIFAGWLRSELAYTYVLRDGLFHLYAPTEEPSDN